jgi:hypothetical protein
MKAGSEAACALRLKRELKALQILSKDYMSWVELQLENWRTLSTPSRELKKVVRELILASHPTGYNFIPGQLLAEQYFNLHEKLMSDHLMSHEEAVAFLSHSFLIAHLAESEKLSAAQISNVLSQRDHRAKFSRQAVTTALQTMRIESAVTEEAIISLFKRDAAQELGILADADFDTAAEIAAEAGLKLGFVGDLDYSLKVLNPTLSENGIKSPFTPYLQILHYQCLIAEFADHAVKDIYEFSPRGRKGEWLHQQYPDSISGAANPFLNNAKSVEILDISWVRAKKTGERSGALALLTILDGMQAMGFAARRELAWRIRLWLHRIIRLAGMIPTIIPEELQERDARRLLAAISEQNTQTFGILEQRLVDTLAALSHPDWRSRGLGAPVNATNLSGYRFGDCEFVHSASANIEAYESHGGTLTAIYVQQHLSTLRKTIAKRRSELEAVTDVEKWSIKIVFVAHEILGEIPELANVSGLDIRIEAVTFKEFIEDLIPEINVDGILALNRYVLTPLREQRTPNEVRRKLLEIISD